MERAYPPGLHLTPGANDHRSLAAAQCTIAILPSQTGHIFSSSVITLPLFEFSVKVSLAFVALSNSLVGLSNICPLHNLRGHLRDPSATFATTSPPSLLSTARTLCLVLNPGENQGALPHTLLSWKLRVCADPEVCEDDHICCSLPHQSSLLSWPPLARRASVMRRKE